MELCFIFATVSEDPIMYGRAINDPKLAGGDRIPLRAVLAVE